MNIKFTTKSINDHFSFVITIPYCELQHLLMPLERVGYTCGTYGWNSDIYEFSNVSRICYNGTCISTGYRPVKGYRPSTEKIRFYDTLALNIMKDNNLSYVESADKLAELTNNFIAECLQDYKENCK